MTDPRLDVMGAIRVTIARLREATGDAPVGIVRSDAVDPDFIVALNTTRGVYLIVDRDRLAALAAGAVGLHAVLGVPVYDSLPPDAHPLT